MQAKNKVQKLKDTRDYSFLLSDDVELPAPANDRPPRSVSVPNSGVLLSATSYLALYLWGFKHSIFIEELIQVFC